MTINVSAWGVCSRISLQQLSSSEILRTCPPPWFCESHPSCCRILLENFIFMFRSVRLAPEIRFRKLCESCRIMQNSLALPDTTAVLRSYPYRIRTGSYPYSCTVRLTASAVEVVRTDASRAISAGSISPQNSASETKGKYCCRPPKRKH